VGLTARAAVLNSDEEAATSFMLGDDLREGGRGEAAALRAHGGVVMREKVAAWWPYWRGIRW
jgi:hypothetical protein